MPDRLDTVGLLPFITGRADGLLDEDLRARAGELSDAVRGRSVLVIGAAGSIGFAFLKQLIAFGPRKVVALDTNENGLTEVVRDLRSTHGLAVPGEFLTYPVGFHDGVARKIMAHHGPFDIVANFAAHKHVRSEKDIFSVEAMLENNVFRARDLLADLEARPPEHFFCVSTDKAANPANIMGASKKLMEMLLMAHADRLPVTTARFANVAFSNGSLPQGFLERFARGQPLSAPSDVRRYFVTQQESGQICLFACLLGSGGEIFFPTLDAGRHERSFAEIAEAFLHARGLKPVHCKTEDEARERAAARRPDDPAYPVFFFESDTSGEKPFEEFYADDETPDLTRFRGLGVLQGRREDPARIEAVIARLRALFDTPDVDKAGIVSALASVVPGFAHVETGKSLDSRM